MERRGKKVLKYFRSIYLPICTGPSASVCVPLYPRRSMNKCPSYRLYCVLRPGSTIHSLMRINNITNICASPECARLSMFLCASSSAINPLPSVQEITWFPSAGKSSSGREAYSNKLPFLVFIAGFQWWKSTKTGRQTFPLTPQMEWIDGRVDGWGRTEELKNERTDGRREWWSFAWQTRDEREEAWKKWSEQQCGRAGYGSVSDLLVGRCARSSMQQPVPSRSEELRDERANTSFRADDTCHGDSSESAFTRSARVLLVSLPVSKRCKFGTLISLAQS